MTGKNDITGDTLVSRVNTKQFEDNFDRIFGKEKICPACNGYGWFDGVVNGHLTNQKKCHGCSGTGRVKK